MKCIPLRFQSTLPMRGATLPCWSVPTSCYFNPRSPCGERPIPPSSFFPSHNFNPRSPCGERPCMRAVRTSEILISIHAPHAGSDVYHHHPGIKHGNFNPRSPCGERQKQVERVVKANLFQSTLPMRGATKAGRKGSKSQLISIHAPHAGSDAAVCAGY